MTPSRLYRLAAIAEMITWTGLLTAMAAKYSGLTDVLIRPAGLAHGAAFLTYLMTNAFVGLNQRWSLGTIAAGFASTFVPYATWPYDRWLEKRRLLDGDWDRTPGDGSLRDRVRVTALTHPVIALLLALVLVSAVMAGLLWLGPPTKWGQRFSR